jgi:hypothetical protein
MRDRIAVVEAITDATQYHVLFEKLIRNCENSEAFPVAVCGRAAQFRFLEPWKPLKAG